MATMNTNAKTLCAVAGRRAARAFTLIEILVVVVILGIAAAVIVPSMGSRDDLKAAAAARIVMADLIYAQNRAITTQQKHYVVFTTSSTPQNYRLVTAITPLTNIPHPVTHDSEYLVRFGQGGTGGLESISLGTVSFEGQTTLAFDELGVPYYYDPNTNTTTALSASNGSGIEIKCGTQTLKVVIEPYTGEIRVD